MSPPALPTFPKTIGPAGHCRAKSKIDGLLAQKPENADALFMKGRCSPWMGIPASALTHYQKAIAAPINFLPAYSATIFSLLQGKQD